MSTFGLHPESRLVCLCCYVEGVSEVNVAGLSPAYGFNRPSLYSLAEGLRDGVLLYLALIFWLLALNWA